MNSVSRMLARRFGDEIRNSLDEMHGGKYDLACRECKVGINNGEETFIVKPNEFVILCKVCTEDLRQKG